jgi:muconolactone delta-isomerase
MRPDTVPQRRVVPTGESSQTVFADVRACKAAQSGRLATHGHLLRPWAGPPGESCPLGLLRAQDPADMQVMRRCLSLDAWIPVETTRLTPLPSNPALAAL